MVHAFSPEALSSSASEVFDILALYNSDYYYYYYYYNTVKNITWSELNHPSL